MATLLSTDPITWKLDENSDLHIDPVLGVTFVSGPEAALQGARTRLRLFMSEWFRNRKVGMPYYQELLGDASKDRNINEKWKASVAFQLLDTPGIVEVRYIKLDLDPVTRKQVVRWSARLEFADTPGTDTVSDEVEVPGA